MRLSFWSALVGVSLTWIALSPAQSLENLLPTPVNLVGSAPDDVATAVEGSRALGSRTALAKVLENLFYRSFAVNDLASAKLLHPGRDLSPGISLPLNLICEKSKALADDFCLGEIPPFGDLLLHELFLLGGQSNVHGPIRARVAICVHLGYIDRAPAGPDSDAPKGTVLCAIRGFPPRPSVVGVASVPS